MTLKISRCRSCRAPIIWMITNMGKNIPVDPDDVDEADLEWGRTRRGTSAPIFDPQAHTSHFATCPNADAHRKRL